MSTQPERNGHMRIRIALTAFFCLLACCALVAQNRTGQGSNSNTRGGLMTSSASGKTSSAKASGGRGIFDIATSSDSAGKNTSASPAAGRTATKASPFGTTSPRTRTSSTRRWKANSKLADCIREKAIPSNTNFSFSGTITNIVTDGRYTILTMFDSVSTKTESGADADVPVMFTVVMDAEVAANTTFKTNSRKSFTVDSNYVYFVWDDSGCTVRAVDNSLTEQDQTATNAKKR